VPEIVPPMDRVKSLPVACSLPLSNVIGLALNWMLASYHHSGARSSVEQPPHCTPPAIRTMPVFSGSWSMVYVPSGLEHCP